MAATLLRYARGKDHAWPAVARLAADIGRCRRTVQVSLVRLKAAGWIEAEAADNATGRVIILAWRRAGCASPAPTVAPPPPPPAAPEEVVIVKRHSGKESAGEIASRPRPEEAHRPAPAPKPAPARGGAITRADLQAWAEGDDPILKAEALRRLAPRPTSTAPEPSSVVELLERIRERPDFVVAAAEALARDLDDRRSWSGLHAICRRAWEGTVSPEALVIAHREATSGRAKVPGAVFSHVVRRESRRP